MRRKFFKFNKASQNKKRNYLTIILMMIGLFISSFLLAKYILEVVRGDEGDDVNLEEDELQQLFSEESSTLVESSTSKKKWILVGQEFSDSEKTLNFELKLNQEANKYAKDKYKLSGVYEILDTSRKGNLPWGLEEDESKNEQVYFTQNIYVGDLKPGKYQIQAKITFPYGQVKSEPMEFVVSYPLYVTWTHDWEGYDATDEFLNEWDEMSKRHYDFPQTHFFNPYIYINPAMGDARREFLTNYVKDRQKNRGDSIGLHLHLFPDLILAAGVEVNPEARKWGSKMEDGYDTLTIDYSTEDVVKILTWAKTTMEEKGFGQLTMYRAGGWFANIETLQAIEQAGFILDSSGRTGYEMGTNRIKIPWNLNTTTQPYQPNIYDQNSAAEPAMDLWEFPNNGGDSYHMTDEEMKQRFNDNFKGEPLTQRTVITYLDHPHWFDIDKPKLESLFSYIDNFVNENEGKGPVVYTTLEKVYNVWQLD